METALKKCLHKGLFENVSPEHSRRMGSIRGTGNKTTEKRFRAALVRAGVGGWQVHPGQILGRPDVYFARERVAVFLDGCYWHGCRKCAHPFKTNGQFWRVKINRNRQRDRQTTDRLQSSAVGVLRLWEHEIQRELPRCVGRLVALLTRRRRAAGKR